MSFYTNTTDNYFVNKLINEKYVKFFYYRRSRKLVTSVMTLAGPVQVSHWIFASVMKVLYNSVIGSSLVMKVLHK